MRSPDLKPVDFFLWGNLKTLIYEKPIEDVADLINKISAAGATIRRKTPLRMTQAHPLEVFEGRVRADRHYFGKQNNLTLTEWRYGWLPSLFIDILFLTFILVTISTNYFQSRFITRDIVHSNYKNNISVKIRFYRSSVIWTLEPSLQ